MNIYDLKVRGHILIDQICQHGYTKDEVYSWLEKKLKSNYHYAHFSNVEYEWQAKITLKKLEEMLDTAKQRYPLKDRVKGSSYTKKRKQKRYDALSSQEIKEKVKQLNNKPASLWLRIKNILL